MATTANGTGIVFGDGTHQTTGNVVTHAWDVNSSDNIGYSIIRNPGNCVIYDANTAYPAGNMYLGQDGQYQGGFAANANTILFARNQAADTLYTYIDSIISNWELTLNSSPATTSSNTYINGKSNSPRDLQWSNTGHRLYILSDEVSETYVDQYNLSINYNTNAGMTKDTSLLMASVVGLNAEAIKFSKDGTKLYVLNAASNTNSVIHQYTLSTAWQVSTATYDSKLLNVNTQEPSATSIDFSPDGSSLYVIGQRWATVFQYTLSTPWDVSTGTYSSKSRIVRYLGNSIDTGNTSGSPADTGIYKIQLRSDNLGFYIFKCSPSYISHWTWEQTNNEIQLKTLMFSGITYSQNSTHILLS